MDTQTVLKIIKTIENRLTFKDLIDDTPYTQGMKDAFNQLKNYLDFFIDEEVSQVENDMNDIMNEINDQDRLQADEESRLGQED